MDVPFKTDRQGKWLVAKCDQQAAGKWTRKVGNKKK